MNETTHPPVLLLIEDNFLNRDMLTRRLKRRGFDILEAEDGPQGLEMAREHHPDLLLLDISLPGMDGYEIAQRLKADPDTSDIPIIALTAHALADDRDKALAAGCDAYTTKPIHLETLLEIIQQWLPDV